MNLKVVVTLTILLLPSIGKAGTFNNNLYEFDAYDDVKFVLSDQVSNGCFTNLDRVSDYAKSKISLSGMNLIEDGEHSYNFIVSAIGRKINGICQGNITVGLYTEIILHTGIRGLVTIKEIGYIGYRFNGNSFNEEVMDQIGLFFKK